MEITQTDIHKFYNLVQDRVSNSITNDVIDLDVICKDIIRNLDNIISSETYESQTCNIQYDREALEIKIWFFSLIFLSWTLMNLSNKVKEGHCHNIDHSHGDQIPRKCFDGRKFHYSIYQECIRSFYNSLDFIEEDLNKYRF